MNNGKFKQRVKVKLVNNTKDYKKHISKPSFVSQKIFSKNFVAIHKIKPVLILINQSMLEYIGTKYDNFAKLLFTDTDSLVYETEADAVHKDFYEDKNLFDFSDYAKDSKCFHSINKKVIGKIKDDRKNN